MMKGNIWNMFYVQKSVKCLIYKFPKVMQKNTYDVVRKTNMDFVGIYLCLQKWNNLQIDQKSTKL